MNCKACNKEFEPIDSEKFCSAVCSEDYARVLNRANYHMRKAKKEGTLTPFLWESVLKRKLVANKPFFISNASLDEIYGNITKSLQFEELLSTKNLMVVRLEDELDLSVIKKSII